MTMQDSANGGHLLSKALSEAKQQKIVQNPAPAEPAPSVEAQDALSETVKGDAGCR
jgi:hypothetical protein